jgi:hypothetical protein
MNEDEPTVTYTLDERKAINLIRKTMLRKPEIIQEIMRDTSYQLAERVLLQAKEELVQLLAVNRAFITAASTLVKQQKMIVTPDNIDIPKELT